MRTLCALALILAMPAPAFAGQHRISPAAARHMERGNQRMARKRYEAALAEYEAGYAIDPNPTFLYNIGQAHRLGGRCALATRAYEDYLRTAPSAERAELARRNIEACRPPAEPAPAPAIQDPEEPPARELAVPEFLTPDAPTLEATPAAPWYRDLWGGLLATAGSLCVIGGTALWLQARGDIEDANTAARAVTNPDAFARIAAAAHDAESRQTTGVVLLLAGSATLAGAIVRYALHAENQTDVAATPLPGGGTLTLSRRF